MGPESGFWGRLRDIDTAALRTLQDSGEPEGLMLEFKSFGTKPREGVLDAPLDDLAETLCGMANTAGGRLILGAVEERTTEQIRRFVGVPDDRRRAALQRAQAAAVHVQPPVVFDHQWVEGSADDGWILVLEIRRDDRDVRQYLGRYLMRVNSRNEPMPHAMVVAAIKASLSEHGTTGWLGSALDGSYPFKVPDEQNPRPQDDWVVSAMVRSTFPVHNLRDRAEDVGEIVQSLIRDGVAEPIVLRSHIFSKTDKTIVHLGYDGSATETQRGGPTPIVAVERLEQLVRESIVRMGRLVFLLGYRGSVEVHAKLARAFAPSLLLQWSDGRSAKIMWSTTECLSSDFALADLLAVDVSAPKQLTDRFVTMVSRNLDLTAMAM